VTDDVAVSAKIAASFQRLTTAADHLNVVSAELGVYISTLDVALQRLNLGISTWVPVEGYDNATTGDFDGRELGYTKLGSKWGIALRSVAGNYGTDPEGITHEQWLFNDAPRAFRIKAVEKLPDLLEKLAEEADDTAGMIKGRIVQAQQLIAGIQKATAEARSSEVQRAAFQPSERVPTAGQQAEALRASPKQRK